MALRALLIAWSTLLITAAAWVTWAGPEQGYPIAEALSRSELAHTIAHIVLYGGLAAIAWRVVGRNPRVAFTFVLWVGLLQEAGQCIVTRHLPGRGEAFDLAVDAAAGLLVLYALNSRVNAAAARQV